MKKLRVPERLLSVLLSLLIVAAMIPAYAEETEKTNITSYTAPTAVSDFAESDTPQPIITAGSANGGTMYYRLGLNGAWSTEIPTSQIAATHTVYWYVKGDETHNDLGSQTAPQGSVTLQSAHNDKVMFNVKSHGYNLRLFYKSESDTVGKWIQTTYGDNGYTTVVKVGNNAQKDLSGFQYGKVYTIDGVEIAVFAEIVPGSETVSINYELKNTTDSDLSVQIASHADTMVGGNDSARVYIENGDTIVMENHDPNKDAYGAKYKLTSGLGQFTSMWYGHYGSRTSNLFNNTTATEPYTGDSGIAFSWTVPLPAGEDASLVCGGDIGNLRSQSIKASGITAVYGDTDKAVEAELTRGDGELSYFVSSGTDIISIDEHTGALTILGAGAATVAITASATEDFDETTKMIPIRIYKKETEIDWQTTEFVYDGQPHSPEGIAKDIIEGDSCSVIVENPMTAVGNYTSNYSDWSLSNSNYIIAPEPNSVEYSIVKRELIPSWGETTFVYDGKPHLPTMEVTNFVGEDTCNSSVSGEQTECGTYTASAEITDFDETKYCLPEDLTKQFTITQADPKLNVAPVSGKTFGDDKFALSVTQVGDSEEYTFASSNEKVLKVDSKGNVTIVGAGKAVVTVGVKSTNNYRADQKKLEITIAKKAASLEVSNVKYSKTYGDDPFKISDIKKEGESAVAFKSDNTSVAAVDASGNVTVKGAGTAKITLSMNESANYKPVSKTIEVSVAPKKAVVTADNKKKTYGDADPKFTSTVTGLVGSDKLTISYDRKKGEDAGSYTVTPSVKDNANYSVTVKAGVLTIEKANQTITVLNDKITYGSTEKLPLLKTNSGAEITYSLKDKTPKDVVSVDKNGNISPLNAGTAIVVAAAAETKNYLPLTKEITVTTEPKEIGIEWGSSEFTYDGKLHAPEAAASGLVGKDECTVTVAGAQTDAGSYTASATALSNSNYILPENKTQKFTIAKADPALAADDVNKTYGDAAFELSVNKNTDGAVTFSGGDEKIAAVDKDGRVNILGAGKTEITAAVSETKNYKAGTISVNVTIAPKAVTLEWSNTEFVYDSKSHCPTVTVKGLVGNDECSAEVDGAQIDAGDHTAEAVSLSNNNYTLPKANKTGFKIDRAKSKLRLTSEVKTFGDEPFVLNVIKESDDVPAYKVSDEKVITVDENGVVTIVGAGKATVTAEVDASKNYEAGSAEAEITVEKQPGAVNVEAEINAVYGDEPFSAVKDEKDSKAEFEFRSDNENVATVDGSGVVTIKGAGKAAITVIRKETANSLGAEAKIVLNVKPKEITVSADDLTKKYGEADPELTYTVDGLVEGDTLNVTLDRAKGENVGEYVITPKAEENKNYSVKLTEGKLTVTKAEQTITAEDITADIADKTAAVNAQTSGDGKLTFTLKSGDSISIDENGAITLLKEGSAVITVTAEETENYSAASAEINVTVTAAGPHFTVKFDKNGHGASVSDQSVAEGKSAEEPEMKIPNGWTFEGWYTDPECTQAYDFSDEVTSDITLYAKWTSLAPAEPTSSLILGDLDRDGQIMSADALAALRFSVGIGDVSDDDLKVSDIDEDKAVTSADALEILRFSVGSSSNERIGKPIL